ncbi:MAG: hypothetical protein ACRD5L_13090 [Bryobacteraceae bacterium]
MAAPRSARRHARRTPRTRKSAARGQRIRQAKNAKAAAKPGARPGLTRVAAVPLPPALYRLCKSGWAVIVERTPNAQGTRFVCPFCPVSHRVPGPVRGFRKMRRAQWIKLRRVEE